VGGDTASAGDLRFKVMIFRPICRPLSAEDYSRNWLEMEGKSPWELDRVEMILGEEGNFGAAATRVLAWVFAAKRAAQTSRGSPIHRGRVAGR
jgi:hypothetical protein